MNERERANRLAHDLDQRLQTRQVFTGQTAPDDRPLLQLAGHLTSHKPFSPTVVERAQLRHRFEQLQTSKRSSTMQKSLPHIFRPAVQTALWGTLLLGVLAITTVLIANLLGKPVSPASGPSSTAAAPNQVSPTAASSVTAATPTPLPASSTFPFQFQTVKDIDMQLREVSTAGSSLRATLCYTTPDERSWRLEDAELKVGDDVLPFYPSSSAPTEGGNGMTCETFTAVHPGPDSTGEWTIAIQRLIALRQNMPDCEQVNRQLIDDFPGLSVTCDTTSTAFGYTIDQTPDGMSQSQANRLVSTYMQTEVRSGPWSFTLNPQDIQPLVAYNAPANPVVVPSACDPDLSLIDDSGYGSWLGGQSIPTGITGGGVQQSGDFSFLLALTCDPNFSRLKTAGSERSEINGLGVLWVQSYQGEAIDGGVDHYSGVWPFVMHSRHDGSIDRNSTNLGYEGVQFPEAVLPDFTQSDVRLRYLVKVRTPDGKIEGAALAFTLQREPEGYRPVDVRVESLTDDERKTAENDSVALSDIQLPFPTLPAPEPRVSAETQALLDRLDGWQAPLLSSPGWVHTRTRVEMPRGNDLFAGLTEYTNDDWYQIDDRGYVITHIHIDARLDGTVLQQSYNQVGKSANLTFGGTGTDDFKPYPLDLAYSVKSALKAGDNLNMSAVAIDGRPVIVLTVPGIFSRREAVDAASGAWLYSEVVRLAEGDDPVSGGIMEDRTTLESAERVDAPPPDVLALLGQDFTGYTPPDPFGTPAPAGFDPSKSKLTIQDVNGDDFPGSSFWYGDLYADGYLLGRVDFGSVPGGWCARSTDGSKVAFNYLKNEDDSSDSTLNSSLRWFDLRSLEAIHQPAPEIVNIGALSWSPAEEKLAVLGCAADQKDCGLYLVDPASDQVSMLLSDVYASWEPIWNPDGSQIAFVNTLAAGYPLYVVDITSGEVAYRGNFDADAWQAPADSPTHAWGVSFSRGREGPACFDR